MKTLPTKEDYLSNPGRISALPYHKFKKMWPHVIKKELHVNDYHAMNPNEQEKIHIKQRFFKIINNLKRLEPAKLPDGYSFRVVNLMDETSKVAEVIQACYENSKITEKTVKSWLNSDVYLADTWIWVIDDAGEPAALGIAELDQDLNEGVLDWIQVLPAYRKKGIGLALVTQLLQRLKAAGANFVVVCGDAESEYRVLNFYRKAGFNGDDIWLIR